MDSQKNNLTIALISPQKDAYSETFIQAQRNTLEGNVLYYFGGTIPTSLDGKGLLRNFKKSVLLDFCDVFLRRVKPDDRAGYFLTRSLQRENVDVVLAQFGQTAAECLPAIQGAQIPLVVHFHGLDAYVDSVLAKYADSYRDVFNYARSVIAVSHSMKEQLISLGCDADKITVNPCTPDPSFFAVEPRENSTSFLSVGRFVDKKAPYYLLLAFADVIKEFPDATLKMVGDGPLLNTCQNLSRHLAVAENVYFVGQQTPKEVSELMAGSVGFLQHSVTALNNDREGTPVGVLEASAAGLPVVSTRHEGIEEAIIHETTGYLVNEHNVREMTRYMCEILRDPSAVHGLGRAAREHMKTHYSREKQMEAINTLLRHAVQHHES